MLKHAEENVGAALVELREGFRTAGCRRRRRAAIAVVAALGKRAGAAFEVARGQVVQDEAAIQSVDSHSRRGGCFMVLSFYLARPGVDGFAKRQLDSIQVACVCDFLALILRVKPFKKALKFLAPAARGFCSSHREQSHQGFGRCIRLVAKERPHCREVTALRLLSPRPTGR